MDSRKEEHTLFDLSIDMNVMGQKEVTSQRAHANAVAVTQMICYTWTSPSLQQDYALKLLTVESFEWAGVH